MLQYSSRENFLQSYSLMKLMSSAESFLLQAKLHIRTESIYIYNWHGNISWSRCCKFAQATQAKWHRYSVVIQPLTWMRNCPGGASQRGPLSIDLLQAISFILRLVTHEMVFKYQQELLPQFLSWRQLYFPSLTRGAQDGVGYIKWPTANWYASM